MGSSPSAIIMFGYVWDPEVVDEDVALRLDELSMEYEKLADLGVDMVDFGNLEQGWWYTGLCVAPVTRVDVYGEMRMDDWIRPVISGRPIGLILSEALEALGLEAPDEGPKWYLGACVS